MTLNLAATGFAWYWVLSRHFLRSRAAALLGGLFCAFAPAMVSQSNGHPHITAQYLVPFIVLQVVRLAEPGRTVRRGLVLAALVTAQFYLGLEVLLLVAVGCAVGRGGVPPGPAARGRPRAAGGAGQSRRHRRSRARPGRATRCGCCTSARSRAAAIPATRTPTR